MQPTCASPSPVLPATSALWFPTPPGCSFSSGHLANLGSAQRPSWQPVTPDFNCRTPSLNLPLVYAPSSGFLSPSSAEAGPSSSAPLYPWHLKKCRAQNRCSINAGGSMKTSRFTQQCLQDHRHASRPGPQGSLAPDSHRHFCYPVGWRLPLCLSAFKGTVLTWVDVVTSTPGSYGGGESMKAHTAKQFPQNLTSGEELEFRPRWGSGQQRWKRAGT